jgi:hypothetical protein
VSGLKRNHHILSLRACVIIGVLIGVVVGLWSRLSFGGTVLMRDGKTITGAITPAGESALEITAAGKASVTIQLEKLRSATFDDAPATSQPTVASGWKSVDLGKVHRAGKASFTNGEFSLAGCGWGAWGPKDSGHYLYWPFDGDGQIIAHVASRGQDTEDGGAMAGVVWRATLDADSPFASTLLYPTNEVRFNRRPTEGYVAGPERRQNPSAFEWVRLARNGNLFTASKSKDGRFWQPVKGQVVELPAKCLVGLFVAAGTNAHLLSATFDHVQLIAGTPGPTYFDAAVGPESGLVFVDGTMLAGLPRAIVDGNVQLMPRYSPDGRKLSWPLTEEQRTANTKAILTFPQASVARLRFNIEPPDLDKLAPGHGSGVLLMTGDFMEGEIEKFSYSHYLDVNSVVFGAKRLDVAHDAICAVLREVKAEPAAYQVRLRDGSIIEARSVIFEGTVIKVESALAGVVKFPVAEIVSIEGR